MAVRPFYIESHIDGRETPLQGGPKSKEGKVRTTIYQREDGGIIEAFRIECHTWYDKDTGDLMLTTNVFDKTTGEKIGSKTTKY